MADPKGFLIVPCGYNPSGVLRAVNLDASDNLKVSIEAGLPTAYKIQGYDGANWQNVKTKTTGELIIDGNSPSLLRPVCKTTGFSNTALPAGLSTQTIVTVPASEYWRVTGFSMAYIGTITTVYLTAYIVHGANTVYFDYKFPVVSGQFYITLLNTVLDPGDSVRVQVGNATLNDDLYAGVLAERIY